jgi:hypothetical protein
VLIEIGKRYLRTFLRRRNCGCSPDAAVTACDEHDTMLEHAARPVIGVLVPGPWAHLRLNARLSLLVLRG